MKVLFSKGIIMLSLLSLLSGIAHAQNQDSGTFTSHKFLYGVHLGLTDNKSEIYPDHSLITGQYGTSSYDDRTIHARGFRLAVIGEAALGRCFSLRVMPGVSLFRALNLESVRVELPVDVKFHPFRWGKLQPYIASGLGYGYDFASLRDDSYKHIKPLNAHDLRYTCGMGVDWYTRLVRIGFELKAGFGLLPPNTNGVNANGPYYFYNGSSFTLGINIEA